MNDNLHEKASLSRTLDGLWMVSCQALGEDHLLTQAFETALRTGDLELMGRALALFHASPNELKDRVLLGEDSEDLLKGA